LLVEPLLRPKIFSALLKLIASGDGFNLFDQYPLLTG